MEAIFHRMFENYINKGTWGKIIGVFGGESYLRSKIGLTYILSSTDSVTLYFKNKSSKPNRLLILCVDGTYKFTFLALENYVCHIHSVFDNVKIESFISLFETQTELRLSDR